MPNVKELVIKLQSGTDSTYYASWKFNGGASQPSAPKGNVKAGDLVSIKSGATYYNGVSIPSWVMSQKWRITQVRGDRAVLGKNEAGNNDICSPINTKFLTGGTGGGGGGSVSASTVDHYQVDWYYYTGDSIWFSNRTSDVKELYGTYNAPSNALQIKVSVRPVSKTYKVNDKDVSYWTGSWVSKTYSLNVNPPEKASAPTVTIEKYKLTASLENISDARTDEIKFEVYSGTKVVKSGIVTVLTRRASFSCTIDAGGDYRVRCQSINLNGDARVYGQWSDFSSIVGTMPSAPSKLTVCKATSETSVYLEWVKVDTADTYDIEYTTKKEYFDGSDKTTTVTGIEFTHYEKTGLETGESYFFRVRAVNEKGNSAWSEISSIVIGKIPAAPTTWSSTTTAIVGDPLTLYWVHNAEDGSSQTYAEVEIYTNGLKETYTIKNTEDEDLKDKTSSYVVDTTECTEGMTIQWRVRTAGITKAYGDWSIQRTVDVYAPATLGLSLTNSDGNPVEVLTSFPLYVSALAGPKTQVPIGYHLVVQSNEIYETVDNVGNVKIVNKGDQIYSKYFDITEALLVELSAGNINLENNIGYTITCIVSMNSGLTAETSLEFTVEWTEDRYEPNAEIGIDQDSFSAYVRPYCTDLEGNTIEGLLLSVYRRDFDGEFTEIAKDIDPYKNEFVTDPHPALDYARYRIVATSIATGAVSYYDAPDYPINGKAVIIQWNEVWGNFRSDGDDALEQPPWIGSLLSLPYDIDVSDSNSPDVSLIEYIGRTYPVSYHGTQRGSKSTWNVSVEKSDRSTLSALRRLAIWMGDVYVREPSGSGYWANITVSFSQKHCDLTIPVTLDITRVVGGI